MILYLVGLGVVVIKLVRMLLFMINVFVWFDFSIRKFLL